ncbi:MAG: hypothetical protein INQ03_21600 [Candidatus Heimdallarchaeota archaeon]|nr:hypothetical protein [Candidatus Heimdallarchaeota archaeon]
MKKYYSIALIAIFLLAATAQVSQAQSSYIQTNFELYYYTEAGSRNTESVALFVKQSLAPLGIDVRIFAKPFGQFVGDLLHVSSGRPFDLAHVRFGGGTPTPDFGWHYASDQYFGYYMLQLADADWQAWQLEDIGYTQEEIDDMIYDIDYEMDISERLAKYEEFNDFYYNYLLYDLPLIAQNFRTAMWRGYGGPENELWDPQEGILTSRALGAVWEQNEEGRDSNSTHLRFSQSTPNQYILDGYQSDDNAQTALSQNTQTNLISYDRYNNPHPNIAWNYFQTEDGTYDHDNNATTEEIPLLRFTFLFRDDAMWGATTDYEGNAIPATAASARDMVLAFDLMSTFIESDAYDLSFEGDFAGVVDYEASTTLFTDDTFNIWYDSRFVTPDDYIKYGAWVDVLPHHILGGNLHYYNETDETTVISPVEVGMPFNPWDSQEWNHWETLEGVSHVGPYKMMTLKEGEYYNFRARDDWYFPNEWDVETYYDSADAEIQALETAFDIDLSMFAPFGNYNQEAYYWAYEGTEENHVKPTDQGILTYDTVIIEDINAILIQFEAGSLDSFGSTALGAEQVAAHVDDERFVVKTIVPNRGPELLIFNLLNDHLKKINVRKAISHVLDRDTVVQIYDGFATPWYSIAYPNSGEFDKVQADQPYSYASARDLMRLEGYEAAESNEIVPQADVPDVVDVAGALSIPGFELWMAFLSGMIMIPIARRKSQ